MSLSLMLGWIWLLVALVLLALVGLMSSRRAQLRRILITTGLGALLTAFSLALMPLKLPAQGLVFALSAITVFLLLSWSDRHLRPRNATARAPRRASKLIGTRASILGDMKQGHCKIQIHDMLWDARCDEPIKAGQLVEVIGYDRSVLEVQALR